MCIVKTYSNSFTKTGLAEKLRMLGVDTVVVTGFCAEFCARGEPSLVCDFQDLYRYLIDDFVIEYCKTVDSGDFVLKEEDCSANRKGKRQYLNEMKTRDLLNRLNKYFEKKVCIPRIRRGKRQEIETLIAEEALRFAEYLRDEKPSWNPRIVDLWHISCRRPKPHDMSNQEDSSG
jgi:hypothetical protein